MFDWLRRRKKQSGRIEFEEVHVDIVAPSREAAQEQMDQMLEKLKKNGAEIAMFYLESECDNCGYRERFGQMSEVPDLCPACREPW